MSYAEHHDTSLTPYFVRFGVVLFALYALVAVIRYFLPLPGLSGVSFILPFLTASFVSEKFTKTMRRVPSDTEIGKLATGCILVTLLVNLPLVLIAVFAGGAGSGIGTTVLVIAVGFVGIMLLINYFLIRWSFDGIARKRAEKLGIGRVEDEF